MDDTGSVPILANVPIPLQRSDDTVVGTIQRSIESLERRVLVFGSGAAAPLYSDDLDRHTCLHKPHSEATGPLWNGNHRQNGRQKWISLLHENKISIFQSHISGQAMRLDTS